MTLCCGSSFPIPTSSPVANGEPDLPRNLGSRVIPPRSTPRISRWLSRWRSDRFRASKNRGLRIDEAGSPAGLRDRLRAFHHTPAPAGGDCRQARTFLTGMRARRDGRVVDGGDLKNRDRSCLRFLILCLLRRVMPDPLAMIGLRPVVSWSPRSARRQTRTWRRAFVHAERPRCRGANEDSRRHRLHPRHLADLLTSRRFEQIFPQCRLGVSSRD